MGADLIQQPLTLWKFGTEERVDRGAPVVLWAVVNQNGAAVRFSTLFKQGTQAGYAVTAGKTLVLTRALFSASGNAFRFSTGYSDADVGQSAVADGANAVNLDSALGDGQGQLIALTASTLYDVPVYLEVAAGKFARLVAPIGAATLFCSFFGVEV